VIVPVAGLAQCTVGVTTTGARMGSSGSCRVVGQTLPPMRWETLEAGLAKASNAGKPVVVVFCAKSFKGPATLDTNVTRDAWKASGALAARLLPPEPLKLPSNAAREESQPLVDAYNERLKKYTELCQKYGANANPTLVCLAPDGAVLARLCSPGNQQVAATLKALPEAAKAYAQRKAQEAEKQSGRDKLAGEAPGKAAVTSPPAASGAVVSGGN
jgi:hypothetical protein